MTRNLTAPRRYSLVEIETNDQSNCDRKGRYKSKQVAKDAASRRSRDGDKVRAYECPVCKGWHLTGTDPEIERRRRRL